jgi:hypothetical protein
MLGGLYTRFENGVEQADKTVLMCNEDFSFSLASAANTNDALAARVTVLEALVNQLLNNP